MNERIRQLADQAGATVITTHGMEHVVDGCYVIGPARLEKFAELIVQECLRQVEEQYKPVLEDKEMMMFPHWDGYVQCGVDSYVAIREHFFGVEE